MEYRHIGDRKYWEKVGEDKALKYWRKGNAVEKQINKANQETATRVMSILSAFIAIHADKEGAVDYKAIHKLLSPAELERYKVGMGVLYPMIEKWNNEELIAEYNKLFNLRGLTQMQAMLNEIFIHLADLSMQEDMLITSHLKNTYTEAYYQTHYDAQKGTGFGYVVTALLLNDVMDKITEAWSGECYKNLIINDKLLTLQRIKRTINMASRKKEAIKKTLLQLNKNIKSANNKAIAISRNEMARVLEQSNLEAMKKNGSSSSYILIATLDDRTTLICRYMDSRVYKLSEAKEGINYPPFHYGCRTTAGLYFEDNDLDNWERIARNAETNKNYYVPATMSYEDWEATYVKQY